MNVACVFSIDDAYVMPFQVFFHSLENTESIPETTTIYILHTSTLSHASIHYLKDFLKTYGRMVIFLDASHLIPSNLPINETDHVSPATFYRLFIADILPAEIDQAVYFDADMLALSSVAYLFNEPVNSLVAAADHCSPADGIRLWGKCGGTYFQAGVLVIPLHTWRKQQLISQFLAVMTNERSRIQWWDQDVLNLALRDRWQRLPVWCNICGYVTRTIPMHEIEENAELIHYTSFRKPWNTFNFSPFTAHWDKAFFAAFGKNFDRRALLPSRQKRFKSAVRSRFAGLILGRE